MSGSTSRSGILLAVGFCFAFFLPVTSSAKIVYYWYPPHYMAKVEDATKRLEFLAPHFVPASIYGVPSASTTITLNRMSENSLGINLFFTESGVEDKPQGLLGLTSVKVPFKEDRVVSIVFADVLSFEIKNFSGAGGATPWCVIPVGSQSEDNVLCVPTQDDAKQVIDALATLAVSFGSNLSTPFGMSLRPMTEKELRKHPDQFGCQVLDVDVDGPAAQAGVRAGDILRKVNDATCTLDSMRAAVAAAAAKPQGGALHAEILRRGSPMMLDLLFPHVDVDAAALRQQVADMARASAATSSGGSGGATPAFHLGISGRAVMNSDLAAIGLDKPQGVLVTNVEKGSIADQMQLRVGDVIEQMNGINIDDAGDFAQSVRNGVARTFRVWRKGQTLTLEIPQSM